MNLSFLQAAEAELAEAVNYYNEQRAGLGDEFLVELLTVLERIRRFPQAWPQLSPRVRRCRMRRFPYGLLYSINPAGVLIIAVAHLHREPTYWRQRLAPP